MPQPPKNTSADKPGDAADQAAQKPPEPDEQEMAFRVDEITPYVVAKGFTPQDVAGAFSGTAGSNEITITEAVKRVRDWRKSTPDNDDHLKDSALVPEETG